MDDRQVRLLVVLTAAVVVLGLLYAFVPRRGSDLPWADEATHRVWSLSPDHVEAFSIARGAEEPAVIVRQGDGWRMRSPEDREADPRVVEMVLRELSRIELAVPLGRTDPTELGLGEPPAGRVKVEVRNGESFEVDFGDVAPVGWHTYARAPDGTLVVVPGHFGDDVLLPVQAFRESSLIRYPLSKVVAVELHSPRGELRVYRDSASEWWLDGYGRADLNGLENLLLSLLDLRVEQFFDDLVPEGITEPRHRAVVELADGSRIEARFGDNLPMGRLVQTYVGDIAVIPPERLALLDQGPTNLMDMGAFPVMAEGVDRIEVGIDGRHVEIRGGEGTWRAAGLSPAQAIQLVESLRKAKVALPGSPPIEELGPVAGRVRIHQGDRRTRVIEISEAQGAARRVRDLSGGPITTLDDAWIAEVLERMP